MHNSNLCIQEAEEGDPEFQVSQGILVRSI